MRLPPGSYIALMNADKIAMSGSMIGAAAMVDGTGKQVGGPEAGGRLEVGNGGSSPESSGRNAKIAAGMADISDGGRHAGRSGKRKKKAKLSHYPASRR
ncbi:hypothetical protein VQ056_18610 [Paenibacillus sp. JTLBN-2024]